MKKIVIFDPIAFADSEEEISTEKAIEIVRYLKEMGHMAVAVDEEGKIWTLKKLEEEKDETLRSRS